MSLRSRHREVAHLDWHFPESNREQDYATHTLFRYFGKLPPTVTRKVLEYGCLNRDEKVLDIMCGSGTTAVEARLLGLSSVNVDVNPLSILVGETKTTDYDAQELHNAVEKVLCTFDAWKSALEGTPPPVTLLSQACLDEPDDLQQQTLSRIPPMRNIDYWFSRQAQLDLALLLFVIDQVTSGEVRKLLRVCLAGIIRKASNASSSTGRIFYDRDKKLKPVRNLFVKQTVSAVLKVAAFSRVAQPSDAKFVTADARQTRLNPNSFGFAVCHPPYFALYRYSSDVLRFELEWLGFSRKEISRYEIEDGFKTTRRDLLDRYVEDIQSIFVELHRLLKPERRFCLIDKDSTLGDEQLPVINKLTDAAQESGFKLEAVCDRTVTNTQATYHRSARLDKITTKDHLLFFRKNVL